MKLLKVNCAVLKLVPLVMLTTQVITFEKYQELYILGVCRITSKFINSLIATSEQRGICGVYDGNINENTSFCHWCR